MLKKKVKYLNNLNCFLEFTLEEEKHTHKQISINEYKKYSHWNSPRVLWEFRKGPKPDCGRDDLVNGKMVPKPWSPDSNHSMLFFTAYKRKENNVDNVIGVYEFRSGGKYCLYSERLHPFDVLYKMIVTLGCHDRNGSDCFCVYVFIWWNKRGWSHINPSKFLQISLIHETSGLGTCGLKDE